MGGLGFLPVELGYCPPKPRILFVIEKLVYQLSDLAMLEMIQRCHLVFHCSGSLEVVVAQPFQ